MKTWRCRACKRIIKSDRKPDGCDICGAQADDILEVTQLRVR